MYSSVYYSSYRIGSCRHNSRSAVSFNTKVTNCACDGLTDVELLQGLLTLKELGKLEIFVCISLDTESLISFDGGVRPLLEGFMGSLLTKTS